MSTKTTHFPIFASSNARNGGKNLNFDIIRALLF